METNAAPLVDPRSISRKLEQEWQELADEFLPIHGGDNSNWRYSRPMEPTEPSQGWKLHVSATILNAASIFRACAPYLKSRNIMFKACSTIDMLSKMNSGIFFGFSQVGKFITVYPPNSESALRTAADLDALTAGFEAPRVPYDLPYRPGSCVHYRYGGFRTIEVMLANGMRALAIRDPSGKFWTDQREPGHAVPDWISNPFTLHTEEVDPRNPLCTQFLTYDAVSQRGKGGVYLSIDIREIPARRCILKEGRQHGETSIDGRDGEALVAYEETVLQNLKGMGVPVPEVLASFQIDKHRYLALEYIEGTNLMELCSNPRRKLPVSTADLLAARIAAVVAHIHETGWVWRDCKPFNLIVSADGDVRPIDFEGAVRMDEPAYVVWGTRGYTPPEINRGPVTGSNLPEDLFALGATLYQLYTSLVPVSHVPGKEPQIVERPQLGVLRKGIHPDTRKMITALLDPNPRARPTAREVAVELGKRIPTEPITIRAVRQRRRSGNNDQQALEPRLLEDIPGAEPLVLYDPNLKELAVAD
jgi:hypothetical protein